MGPTSDVHRRPFGWLAIWWMVGVCVELLRLPTLGLFIEIDVVLRAVMWLAILLVTRRRARGLASATLRSVLPLAAVLVVAYFFNWSVLAPRWWFETHRPFYSAAVSAPSPGHIGAAQPILFPLSWLSASGITTSERAASDGSSQPAAPLIFFPQWYGLIDDAGGFIFSPSGAPEGMNMAGMICDRPVDLGEGWWMCGMRPGQ